MIVMMVFKNFLDLCSLKILVKDKTCFKSILNPTSIDLFLTNHTTSSQNTIAISTGNSDFHKTVVTVLKITFKNAKSTEIVYRSYK